jgi:hypothetical protein
VTDIIGPSVSALVADYELALAEFDRAVRLAQN